MPYLFDFGISQEDPLTEQRALDIRPFDRILTVASGGEVPLGLMSLQENLHLHAVDISAPQVYLSRLKLLAALHVPFPDNGAFLGYAPMPATQRTELYRELLRPLLPPEEAAFWDQHPTDMAKGIVHAGRFEQFIAKFRAVAGFFVGHRNLRRLIECHSREEQEQVFNDFIAPRRRLRWLFKIAFHPAVYKNRGLQEQALIHAGKSTGERFYSKFRSFCTDSPAKDNYFLQFFLLGRCISATAYPEYLQARNRNCLAGNAENLSLKQSSLQDAIAAQPKGFYSKIHLSNIGDWTQEADFAQFLSKLESQCTPGTKLCYRYLQKNHFPNADPPGFMIDRAAGSRLEALDRFPFYGILPVEVKS